MFSFTVIIAALILEQLLAEKLFAKNQLLAWYLNYIAEKLDANRKLSTLLIWYSVAFIPSVLVYIVHIAFVQAQWGVFNFFWHVAVLTSILGLRHISLSFTPIRNALLQRDDAKSQTLLRAWTQSETHHLSHSDLISNTIEFAILQVQRYVFGILFFYILGSLLGLGPSVALLYYLTEYASRHYGRQVRTASPQYSPMLIHIVRKLWAYLNYLPARCTAISFAVVGNFEEAIAYWRYFNEHHHATPQDLKNDGLLLAATSGAIHIHFNNTLMPQDSIYTPDEAYMTATQSTKVQYNASHAEHLKIAVALVWRGLLCWLLLLFVLSLTHIL